MGPRTSRASSSRHTSAPATMSRARKLPEPLPLTPRRTRDSAPARSAAPPLAARGAQEGRRSPRGRRCPRRAPRNAPPPTPFSDQVTITLPGHPLRGRPLVLVRLIHSRVGDNYADVEHPDGSPLRVPLEWTDRSIPSPVPTLDGREVCLSVAGLLHLAAVVRAAQSAGHGTHQSSTDSQSQDRPGPSATPAAPVVEPRSRRSAGLRRNPADLRHREHRGVQGSGSKEG